MEKLIPANIVEGKSSPAFSEPIHMDWYTEKEKDDVAQEACATDMAFVVLRQDKNIRPSWTTFNQSLSKDNHAIITVGYMPIIQAPAHELDTINTVVQRCMYISSQLGQPYTVLTVYQFCFCIFCFCLCIAFETMFQITLKSPDMYRLTHFADTQYLEKRTTIISSRYFGTNFHLFVIYIAHDILLKLCHVK